MKHPNKNVEKRNKRIIQFGKWLKQIEWIEEIRKRRGGKTIVVSINDL